MFARGSSHRMRIDRLGSAVRDSDLTAHRDNLALIADAPGDLQQLHSHSVRLALPGFRRRVLGLAPEQESTPANCDHD